MASHYGGAGFVGLATPTSRQASRAIAATESELAPAASCPDRASRLARPVTRARELQAEAPPRRRRAPPPRPQAGCWCLVTGGRARAVFGVLRRDSGRRASTAHHPPRPSRLREDRRSD